MSVNLQQATVPVTALMAVVLAGMGWWVNAQEASVKEVQTIQAELRVEQADLKTQNELLRQLVTQQARLVEEAAKDARENRDTLIRIEAKLERPNGP